MFKVHKKIVKEKGGKGGGNLKLYTSNIFTQNAKNHNFIIIGMKLGVSMEVKIPPPHLSYFQKIRKFLLKKNSSFQKLVKFYD